MFVRCNVLLPDNSVSYGADMKVRERSQESQFVEVEVVTAALKQSKSASDDLME